MDVAPAESNLATLPDELLAALVPHLLPRDAAALGCCTLRPRTDRAPPLASELAANARRAAFDAAREGAHRGPWRRWLCVTIQALAHESRRGERGAAASRHALSCWSAMHDAARYEYAFAIPPPAALAVGDGTAGDGGRADAGRRGVRAPPSPPLTPGRGSARAATTEEASAEGAGGAAALIDWADEVSVRCFRRMIRRRVGTSSPNL